MVPYKTDFVGLKKSTSGQELMIASGAGDSFQVGAINAQAGHILGPKTIASSVVAVTEVRLWVKLDC
jgi:hypothetical protein